MKFPWKVFEALYKSSLFIKKKKKERKEKKHENTKPRHLTA